MCRVALGVPTPSEAPVHNGYPQHDPRTCWSQGKRKSWECRGGQGRPWEYARYVHACPEEERTQRISAASETQGTELQREDGYLGVSFLCCSAASARSRAGLSLEKTAAQTSLPAKGLMHQHPPAQTG